MAEIGFIGLGTMGSAMARRMLEETPAKPGADKLDRAAIAGISRAIGATT